MMDVTRRDFMKASGAVAAALGLHASGLMGTRKALALEVGVDGVPVVWLQGQNCSGCSVSLLNTIHYADAAELLIDTVDMKYHRTLMAGSGEVAQAAAEAAYAAGGYILVVEGAIPTAERGEYCYLWPGVTALQGVKRFAGRADYIVAVGACASYGGVVHGNPNPTGARGLGTYFAGKPVINLPGCPAHPDWVVGTIAYVMANDALPALDGYGRPLDYYGQKVHRRHEPAFGINGCPRFEDYQDGIFAENLSDEGCLHMIGCRGPSVKADCPHRKWTAGGAAGSADEYGVNWCVSAGSPCYGCTEPSFPDGMSPFYNLPQQAAVPVRPTDDVIGDTGGRRRMTGRRPMTNRSGTTTRTGMTGRRRMTGRVPMTDNAKPMSSRRR